MPRIVVLFNLKPGVDAATYEDWARKRDAPTVRDLPSISGFSVHRATGLLGSDTPSPYDYVEVIDIRAMDGFMQDIASDVMQAIASEFQGFADDPQFILTEGIA